MPVIVDYEDRLSDIDGGKSKVARRINVGKEDYKAVLARCAGWNVKGPDMWHRVVSDWRRMLESGGDAEAHLGFMWSNALDRHRDMKVETYGVRMYLQDYRYVLDIGKRYFGALSRFFPLMVHEWVTKTGSGR